MTLTAKDVAEITRLLEESSFDELYLELDGLKLSLKRGASLSRSPSAASAPPAPSAPAPSTASTASISGATASLHATGTTSAPDAAAAANGGNASLHNVSSPLLGTFYRAPKPGAPPYIEIGALVEEDTIVGIIEVMKLMNTVRAGARGRVVEILARDGVLVEYGETLLRIGNPGT